VTAESPVSVPTRRELGSLSHWVRLDEISDEAKNTALWRSPKEFVDTAMAVVIFSERLRR
jgi:hypothetical protein